MEIKNKVFAATATIAAIVAPISASAATSFVDVKGSDYFAEAIQSLTERGIINGYSSDHTFRPYKEVTRGQAAKMIAGALGYDIKNVQNPHFKDVPTTHEFYGAIAALANHGIINGYASTQTFKPDAPMTRHQMAKVIALAFDLQASSEEVPFTDVANDYAKYVAALYEHEITTGTTAKTFGGNTNVKRGQLAAFIYRAENVEAPTENEGIVSLDGTITKVSTGTVEVDGHAYDVPASLLGFVNEENHVALNGASIQGTIQNGAIVSIDSLIIKAQSTQENPVILKGMETPVASLTPIAALVEIGTKITIDTPYVLVKNLKLNELVIASKVQDIRLNATVDKLVVEEGVTAKIHGEANIAQVQVNSEKAVELAVKGTVSKLDVKVSKASIKLGQDIQITDVITTGGDLSSIISNYQSVQKQIANMNGVALPTPKPSDASTGGGTVVIPSEPAPVTVNGVISASTSESVTINGRTYKADAGLSGLFGSQAMEDAEITVKVKNDKIVEISALKIKTAGLLDGKGAVINGALAVDTDGLTVSSLSIKGDVKLTEKVQTSIDFDKVDIAGSLVAEETKTASLRNMRVASLGAVMAAENPVTRLKITFANSTVAFVEIKKVDTELSIHGSTQISILSLESNGSIFADPQVVLPKLRISKGVTHIQLNASIASVEIDTNDDIEITGKGNFESVKVKTEKTVALKTEGTIKELASNTANIQLGTNLKVQDTKTLTGETKAAEDMITNYEEVKENVNKPIIEEDLEDYLAAKILPVEGRYGYATLSVLNSGNYTVKYRLVPHRVEDDLVKVKEKAPADAIVYKEGTQFIPWSVKDIQVYLVDQDDIIVDAYEIPSTWGLEVGKYEVEDDKIIFKTIFSPDSITFEHMYFVNDTQFFMPENLNSYTWELDEDGIPTSEILLPENFAFNADKFSFLGFYLKDKINGGIQTQQHKGDYSERDASYLEALYQLTQHYSIEAQDEFGMGIPISISILLDSYAYEETPIYDMNEDIISYDHHYLMSHINIVIDQYIERLKARRFTSGEDVKAMVIEVNEANKALIEQIEEAIDAVTSLFKGDYHEYEFLDQLAENTGIREVSDAEALVRALPEKYNQKGAYLSSIQRAKNILAQLNKSNVNLNDITVKEIPLNNELIINTKGFIFEEDKSVLHHGTDIFKIEGKEQLHEKLESLGYKVTTSDSSLIVTGLTSPDTIKVTTGTINNSVTSGDTLIIDTTKLKIATPINLEGFEKTYTYEDFLKVLKSRFADATIHGDKDNERIFVLKKSFSEEEILNFPMSLYNVQEVTLSFSEAVQIGEELELIFDGTKGDHVAFLSTATVSGNEVKIVINTLRGYTPGFITVKGLVDEEGKVVVIENTPIARQ